MNKRYLFVPPAVLALVLLCASCAGPFSVPTGAAIKGSPSIEAPLGSRNFYLSDVFDSQDIRSSMGSGDKLRVYEYIPPSGLEAKTYLIHYNADPVTVDLNVGEFGFNLDPIEGETVAIPEVTFSSGNGYISISPPNVDEDIEIRMGDGSTFVEGRVKEGYISLQGWGADFSGTVVTLKSTGKSDQQLTGSPQNGSERRYDLAGKSIYQTTQIHLGGSISGPQLVWIEPSITVTAFDSVKVKLTTSPWQESQVNFGSKSDWLKSVTFAKTGFGLTLSPRVDGLNVKVSGASELGIVDKTEQTGTGAVQFEDTTVRTIPVMPGMASSQVKITLNPEPGTGKEVTIYADDEHPLKPGGTVTIRAKPESLFDWTAATILPDKFLKDKDKGKGDVSGLNIGELTEALGSSTGTDMQFKQITMNLYITGNNENLTQNLTLNLTAKYDGREEELPNRGTGSENGSLATGAAAVPPFDPQQSEWKSDLPAPGYKNTDEITGVFQASPRDLTIEYEIGSSEAAGELLLTKGAADAISIKPDIVIELPLQFLISAEDGKDYAAVKLKLTEFTGGEDKEDVFSRTGPDAGKEGEDIDFIDQIRSAGLKVKYQNTLTNASLYLTQDDDGQPRFEPKLIFDSDSKTGPLDANLDLNIAEELRYPFMPVVEVRVPLDAGNPAKGTLTVRPDTAEEKKAGINMLAISATVKTDLDFTF
jgi:hypothetical protein